MCFDWLTTCNFRWRLLDLFAFKLYWINVIETAFTHTVILIYIYSLLEVGHGCDAEIPSWAQVQTSDFYFEEKVCHWFCYLLHTKQYILHIHCIWVVVYRAVWLLKFYKFCSNCRLSTTYISIYFHFIADATQTYTQWIDMIMVGMTLAPFLYQASL